jgi:hypothetical protein
MVSEAHTYLDGSSRELSELSATHGYHSQTGFARPGTRALARLRELAFPYSLGGNCTSRRRMGGILLLCRAEVNS